jgi:hypothetical protein
MLIKQQAIRECKELWEEIDKSGLSKNAFLGTDNGEKWRFKFYFCNCPLCEYDCQQRGKCCKCPLMEQYGKSCGTLGFRESSTPSRKWLDAIKGLRE